MPELLIVGLSQVIKRTQARGTIKSHSGQPDYICELQRNETRYRCRDSDPPGGHATTAPSVSVGFDAESVSQCAESLGLYRVLGFDSARRALRRSRQTVRATSNWLDHRCAAGRQSLTPYAERPRPPSPDQRGRFLVRVGQLVSGRDWGWPVLGRPPGP